MLCLVPLQIETRNNKLEMQSVNNKSLIEELDKLLERLRIPTEVLSHIIFMFLKSALCFKILSVLFSSYVRVLVFNLLFLLNAVCDMPYRGLI